MLIYVYLFALVVGGVLLVASIVLGGDAADADADLDAGADLEVDADVEVDSDVGHGHGHGHGVADGAAGIFGTLFSLRFWTFFAAFFGLTGLVLDGLDLVEGHVGPLLLSIGMGAITGFVTVAVMRSLARGTTGQVPTAEAYAGQTGRVILAFGPGELGKVRLELGGTTVDVLARTDELPRFRAGDQALVVEMQKNTAFVAHLGVPSLSPEKLS